MTSTRYRLPRNVIPLDYDVHLAASPKRAGFDGALTLTARVLAPTATIELHALDLTVGHVTLGAGKLHQKGRVRVRRERETIELVFAKALAPGKHIVTLAFRGKLNPSMHGLYLARDGAERAVVSQCEAADARRIFPCFDEPDLKATLRWRVLTDADLTVISNGALVRRQKKRGTALELHTFARTRVIPSYLAAVAIGRFEGSVKERVAGTPCRVWCGTGKLEQTGFAREVTAHALPYLQEYFGQKYNYGKLDQVAVPGFDAGAMENVGAIFYRQGLLLMQPGAASWGARKRIAEVIAHELSHQWFGNLVTMTWWDDLWLNEAFATWVAFKTVDAWQPTWRMWDEFLESQEAALEADALASTHPVYAPVHSPAEATELFDVITYEKGCAVLRMVESYVSQTAFRDGIRRYQTAFKNGNARGLDLWTKLGEASGEPIGALMQEWITQPGFPLVSVDASTIDGRTALRFLQRRFFANPNETEKPPRQRWSIPLVLRYDGGHGPTTLRVLLSDAEQTVTLPTSAAWVYPNDDAASFVRLRLSDELLAAVLAHGLRALSPATRKSLIDDQWALVRAGLSTSAKFMDVLLAFAGERDYVVVRTLVARLAHLEQRLVREEERPLLRAFARHLFGAQVVELGWDNEPQEPEERGARRASVISALGDLGRTPAVLDEAERRVELEIHDPTALDANLAGTLVALGALRGDARRLARYVEVYLRRKQAKAAPELQARYLAALTYFEDPAAVDQVLAHCLDGTVPQEQLRTVLAPMLGRRAAQHRTWAFIKDNWDVIGPRVGLMGVSRLVESCGSLPVELADEVASFFAAHPVDEAKRALAKAEEALALRRELVQREAARLSEWLVAWAKR